MEIYFGRKKTNIEVKKVSQLGKVSGLMFKSIKTPNLLFEFTDDKIRAIHSYFVFFPFLAIWLDEKNKVIEHSIVKPFTSLVKPQKPFRKLVEVPLTKREKNIIELIVGKGKI